MRNNFLSVVIDRSLLMVFTVVLGVLAYAQRSAPPPPPVPGSGGVGGVGPGQIPNTGIDMYVMVLGIIAVTLLFAYAKKYRKQVL